MPTGADTESTVEPPSIWAALDQWAKNLDNWQRYIVGIAATRGKLNDAEIAEAYRQFSIAKKLVVDDGSKLELVTPDVSGRPNEVLSDQIFLSRVDELRGINALPADAALTFIPSLTVIYGRNGAGKSGFARLLANACFSRQKPQIIADIYAEEKAGEPSASFHLTIGGASQDPIVFPAGVATSPLKRITVFDAAVARHHITQSAAFEFKPIGFDVFPEVVRVYGALTEHLDAEIATRTRPNDFPQSFLGGGTEIHTIVSNLGVLTKLETLRQLAQYGEGERSRIDELDKQIIALQSQSPKEVLRTLREARADIETLGTQLENAALGFSVDAIERRNSLAAAAKEATQAAAILGSDQFRRPFFRAVGTPEWEGFAASAHALARQESKEYARDDDRCLLCERPLDEASRTHINELLAFVEGDARKVAGEAQRAIDAELATLRALDLKFFATTSRVRSHVLRLNPETETLISGFVGALNEAWENAVSSLRAHSGGGNMLDLQSGVTALKAQLDLIDADVLRLEAGDIETSIASLTNERRALRHRNVLSQLLSSIETYVTDAVWAASATRARAGLSTRPITDKEKELFGKIVGDGYKSRLLEECEKLDCKVPVEMQTVGRSGQTLRSLAMRGGHKPEAILSEGEQKAVALADFLTEVGFNPASAGIVFDDPVNSQDHQRKECIARRLVSEAKCRQVIVFTHDLVFLNQLFVVADEAAVEIEGHWVDRAPDGRPGRVALSDSPVTSRSYETTRRAAEALATCRSLTGTAQEDAIRKGMGALRTTLEETVVRKIFKDAVPRWTDQVRVTTLRRVNWDNSRVDEICDLYETISRFIEGHSHTDEARGAPTDPSELEKLIARTNDLIKWAKSDRKKPEG